MQLWKKDFSYLVLGVLINSYLYMWWFHPHCWLATTKARKYCWFIHHLSCTQFPFLNNRVLGFLSYDLKCFQRLRILALPMPGILVFPMPITIGMHAYDNHFYAIHNYGKISFFLYLIQNEAHICIILDLVSTQHLYVWIHYHWGFTY